MSQVQNVITSYVDAFTSCYPSHNVKVTPGKKSRDGERLYNVEINGDKGDRPMTLGELRQATEDFRR